MIYQHRLVIARRGRLEKRHEAFQSTALVALDGHGSVLIGAWEVYVGPDAGSAVWQLRQFESLAAWEQHQERVRADQKLDTERSTALYPHLDEVDTSIIRLVDDCQELPASWPAIEAVKGSPRGYIEQRILHFQPGTSEAHHAFYRERILPSMNYAGVQLLGLFDTVIGPGSTNGRSLRSVELRRFDDLSAWQYWREAQDTDQALATLVKNDWLSHIGRVDSTLLRPLDYSRIR